MTTDLDSPTTVLPFGWENAPAETLFRLPTSDDPAPGIRRVLAMSLYAAVLGLAGAGVGIRGLVSTIGGGVPGWYVPMLVFLGLFSVVLSMAGFLSIHRKILPYVLHVGAALPLTAAVFLAVAY